MKAKIWKLVTLLLIAGFAVAAIKTVSATGTLQPSSTISKVNGFPVYDSGKSEMFVLQGDGSIAIIPYNANSVQTTIDTGITPGEGHELAYDSAKGEIFVTSGGYVGAGGALAHDPIVQIISDGNNSIVGTVIATQNIAPYRNPTFSRTPLGMAYDPSMGEIFLCDNGGGYVQGGVWVISDSDNQVVTEIGVPYAHEAVYDPAQSEIFVTNGTNSVTVINDKTNEIITSITVGNNPYGIAYDSNKGEIFVFNENDGTVSVLSDSPPQVIETIKGITPEADHPISIAYDSNKGELFVSNVTISDSTNTVVAGAPIYTYPSGSGSFQQNFGNVAYDSAKGEMFAGGLTLGIGVFQDSSIPSTSSSTASTPTPKVPEFGGGAFVSVAVAMAVVAVLAVAVKAKKRKQLGS